MDASAKEGALPPNKCDFWLSKKRRACGMLVKAGATKCGNHTENGPARVPCEFCKTNIPAAAVEKHLRRCPAKAHVERREHVPYFVRDVNVGAATDASTAATSASRPPRGDALRQLAKRVREACARVGIEPGMPFPDSRSTEQCALAARVQRDAQRLAAKRGGAVPSPHEPRHAAQHASIVAHMVDTGLVRCEDDGNGKSANYENRKANPSKNKPVYAELGAGRGYLSHFLLDAYGPLDCVLVERGALRFKAERSIGEAADERRRDSMRDARRVAQRERHDSEKNENENTESKNKKSNADDDDDLATAELEAELIRTRRKNSSCVRLRLDIKDLWFPGVDVVNGRDLVLTGKHLCGSATDLSLRSLFPEYEKNIERNTENIKTRPTPTGVCVATCCHHRCEWGSYVNRGFIAEQGFSEVEFGWLTRMSSWGVLGAAGHGGSADDADEHKGKKRKIPENENEVNDRLDTINNTCPPSDGLDMSPKEKHKLGCMIKTFLDVGRLRWLQEKGFKGSVRGYCEKKTSPENRLLVAGVASSG